MQFSILTAFITAAVLAGGASAHPHERSEDELAFHAVARRSLADCQGALRRRGGPAEQSIARRKAWAEKIREERGIEKSASILSLRFCARLSER